MQEGILNIHKRTRIVFFCSGNGGNMKFLYFLFKTIKEKQLQLLLDASIEGVICDRYCNAYSFGERNGIKTHYHSFEKNKKEDSKLIHLLNNLNPDVIITNVHKILSTDIVNEFKDKLINLHYSLLPSFAGTIGIKPLSDAIAQGCKFVGATCHKVTIEVDMGEILAQSCFITSDIDPIGKMFKSGCITLLNGILNLQKEPALLNKYDYNDTQFSPSIQFDHTLFNLIFKELENDYFDRNTSL